MSIPLGIVTFKNNGYIFWRGTVGTISYGQHTQFDVARRILGAARSEPDIRAMMDTGWSDIEFQWEGVNYAIRNRPEGLLVEAI